VGRGAHVGVGVRMARGRSRVVCVHQLGEALCRGRGAQVGVDMRVAQSGACTCMWSEKADGLWPAHARAWMHVCMCACTRSNTHAHAIRGSKPLSIVWRTRPDMHVGPHKPAQPNALRSVGAVSKQMHLRQNSPKGSITAFPVLMQSVTFEESGVTVRREV